MQRQRQKRNTGILHYVQDDDVKQTTAKVKTTAEVTLTLDVLGADAEAYEAGHGAAEDWEWREDSEC